MSPALFTTYDVALREIQKGRKSGHWIWYIIPSSFGSSDIATFFNLPNANVTLQQYLSDEKLGPRYVEMLTAIGTKLQEFMTGKHLNNDDVKTFLVELMDGDMRSSPPITVDYDKLNDSLRIFYNELRTQGKLNNEIQLLAQHFDIPSSAKPSAAVKAPPSVPSAAVKAPPSAAASSAKAPTSALSKLDFVDSLKEMGINEDQIAKAVSNGKHTVDGVLDYIRDNPLEARNLPVTKLSFKYNIDDLKSPDLFVEKYVNEYKLTFDLNGSYQQDTHRSLVGFKPCPELAGWTVIQTIGDGNCLTHAFLQCMSPKYRKIHVDTQATNVEKTAVARAFRLAFANINPNPLLLHEDARKDLNNNGGMADLGEETFASYARLFGVILVVFNVRDNTIMVANLTKETTAIGGGVIFMHGDGGHFSSLLPTVASVPAKQQFVIKYEHAIQIECLKIPLKFPYEFALNN